MYPNFKSVSKLLLPRLNNFLTSRIFEVKAKFIRRTTLIFTESLELLEISVFSKELEKMIFFPRDLPLLKFKI